MIQELADDIPFSLVCIHCDAGMDMATLDQAIADGWLLVEFAPDSPMANCLGLCPNCRDERHE